MALIPDDFDPDAPGDGSGLFGLPSTPDDAAVVIVPVPFEATTSYRQGTRGGPAAIREASGQIDLFDLETGTAWRAGIAMQDEDPDFARWSDAAQGQPPSVVDPLGAQMNARVHAHTAAILDRGAIPGIVGGEHSVSFGAIQAAAERNEGLGILHIDAHADLREAYDGHTWSHASVLNNVLRHVPAVATLVQVGIRDLGEREHAAITNDLRIHTWFDAAVAFELERGGSWGALAHQMIAALPQRVWITFDIDGLDPALCPSTGTPVPGGLSWHQAAVLLRVLAESGRRIVGFDLVEVAPGPDEWDAIVGARLLYKLSCWAIRSQEAHR